MKKPRIPGAFVCRQKLRPTDDDIECEQIGLLTILVGRSHTAA